MVTEGCTGLAQSDDLSVGGGIEVRDVAIPSAAHHAAFAYHDGSHRNLSGFESALGRAERLFHPQFVVDCRHGEVPGGRVSPRQEKQGGEPEARLLVR